MASLFKVNRKLCSPETYNFFGDITSLINIGSVSFEDAHGCIKDLYDKDGWNRNRDIPPMYKEID